MPQKSKLPIAYFFSYFSSWSVQFSSVSPCTRFRLFKHWSRQ